MAPICDNSGRCPLKVPGFGLPIDFTLGGSQEPCFRHGINDFRPLRLTAREVAMLQFMDAVTDKPDWHEKVFNQEIVDKWHDEALNPANDGPSIEEASSIHMKVGLSEMSFEWCIMELRERAKDFERDGFVRTLETASRCIKSDRTIPTELRNELRKAVEPLMIVDDDRKDWQPNSDDRVLNLVHPSLYPLVHGVTPVLLNDQVGLLDCMNSYGKGSTVEQDFPKHDGLWSGRFQWLPAEVKFDGESGTDVRITSYINNLRPELHQDLYKVIERLVSKIVPLWNEVLIKGDGRASLRIATLGAETKPSRVPSIALGDVEDPDIVEMVDEYLELPENLSSSDSESPPPDDWDTNEDWGLFNTVEWKFHRIRQVVHPEPGVSFSYEQWKAGDTGNPVFEGWQPMPTGPALDSYTVRLQDEFRKQGLQVIIKLASIELGPEKQSYPGGEWHLEGMLNEHIVATAIYYYDVENVTTSRLRFRQEARLPRQVRYLYNDHFPLCEVFGAEELRDAPAIQEIGAVKTDAGRLLVFPNTLQHKVDAFELINNSRAGHRRFILFWLVDPYYRIVSTANVPPQQLDWWTEDISALPWYNRDIPRELSDMIVEHAQEGQFSLETAKKLRLELMQERTVFTEAVEETYDYYNLCEH